VRGKSQAEKFEKGEKKKIRPDWGVAFGGGGPPVDGGAGGRWGVVGGGWWGGRAGNLHQKVARSVD